VKKRLPGEKERKCSMALEVDDDSPLGELFNHFKETGEIGQDNFKRAMIEEQLRQL